MEKFCPCRFLSDFLEGLFGCSYFTLAGDQGGFLKGSSVVLDLKKILPEAVPFLLDLVKV